jgi:hypothetical protein
MKRSVVLLLAGAVVATLAAAAPVRAQSQPSTPSTSEAIIPTKQMFVAVTDLDLGAPDVTGHVGQEIVVVYPFSPTAACRARVFAIGPDGSVRFDLSKGLCS